MNDEPISAAKNRADRRSPKTFLLHFSSQTGLLKKTVRKPFRWLRYFFDNGRPSVIFVDFASSVLHAAFNALTTALRIQTVTDSLSTSDPRGALGRLGERQAERYLKRLGYIIVGRREKIWRGDIDLIAVDGRTVVFCEVRTRTDSLHGHPVETIGYTKQRRVSELAAAYLRKHHLGDCHARIDVVAVTLHGPSGRPLVEHYQNAFDSPP